MNSRVKVTGFQRLCLAFSVPQLDCSGSLAFVWGRPASVCCPATHSSRDPATGDLISVSEREGGSGRAREGGRGRGRRRDERRRDGGRERGRRREREGERERKEGEMRGREERGKEREEVRVRVGVRVRE